MALEIIGAGFGRTGTDSTRVALNQLGFPCYHMREVMRTRGHVAFWTEVADAPQGARHDWERVFSDYTAAVDFPASCVWPELMAAYPDAKVLLTLHPGGPDAWYDSTWETIYFGERHWEAKVLAGTIPLLGRFVRMVRRLVWQRFMRSTMEDRALAVERYLANVEEVKAAVPPERLLIFKVDEGWAPLCEFLGVPAPEGEFPHVNDRKSMSRVKVVMRGLAYSILAVGALALLGLLYAIVPR